MSKDRLECTFLKEFREKKKLIHHNKVDTNAHMYARGFPCVSYDNT